MLVWEGTDSGEYRWTTERVTAVSRVLETTMTENFTADDEGKRVLTSDGQMVGTVEKVDGGDAHVKPDTDLVGSIRRRLGWTDDTEEMYHLESDRVESISDDEITLKRNF